MKKFILFALLALLLPSSAWSYEVDEVFEVNIGTENSPYYMRFKCLGEDNLCIVYGEQGNPAVDMESAGPKGNGIITIPSSVEGMTVVGISSWAFAECQNIKNVGISYRYDNYDEFLNSYWQIGITFSIGDYAFYNCYELTSFSATNVFDDLDYSFYHKVESVPVEVGNYAFFNCSSLQELTVSCIGEGALVGTDVTSITFTGSGNEEGYGQITCYIMDNAFLSAEEENYSKKPIAVNFDESVTAFELSKNAFAGCEITSVYVDNANPYFVNGNDYDHEKNVIMGRYWNHYRVVLGGNRAVIPDDYYIDNIDIEHNAFPCHVDKMVIPDKVKSLCVDAFVDCDTLYIDGLPDIIPSDDYWEDELRYDVVHLPVQIYNDFYKYSRSMFPFLKSDEKYYSFCWPATDYDDETYFRFKVPSGMKAYIMIFENDTITSKIVNNIQTGDGVLLVNNNEPVDSKLEVDVEVCNKNSENNQINEYEGNLLQPQANNYKEYYWKYFIEYEQTFGDEFELCAFWEIPEESIVNGIIAKNYILSPWNNEDGKFNFIKVYGTEKLDKYKCWLSVPSPVYQTYKLTVDVTDEFTYYTDEAPHVENATVIVYQKDSKKEIKRGITGEDGTVSFENLPIGDYLIHVEAENHESRDYEYYREVDKDETIEIFISYTGGVTCEFIVEETSVPDLYNLSVNYTYAVNIPIPYVELNVPKSIPVDDMAVGQSFEFQATLYNNGLIKVNDVALLLPDDIPFMSFVPQQPYQGLSIEAKKSVTITVKATKTAEGDCKDAYWGAAWSYPVGESTVPKNYHNILMSMGNCPKNIEEVDAIVHSNNYMSSQSTVSYLAIDGKKTENVSTDKPYITVSVDVEINQALSLTRQAFRGTMTMNNTYPASLGTIKDIQFNLDIIDPETGEKVTDKEFDIQLEKLSGFEGEQTMNGPWSLASGKQGEVSVLMIPTKYAAPTKPKTYKLLPSISYIDPLLSMANPDEGRKEENLIPKTITVNPTPQLVLDYFIPKTIVGDDPMTEDKVEASEPAELAILIRNEGYGDANKLKITTKQPEIVDNRDGLLIDFAITGGTVNGKDVQMTEGKELVSDFGTLKARSTAYAQWWLTSTLLGLITKYDVSYFHETSYDNENLSLLNAVNVHSLVRSIKKDKSLFGFLTDDEETSEYHFYGKDGSVEDVQRVDDIDVTQKNQNSYVVYFGATESGYVYGYIQDPSDGEGKLNGAHLIDSWREDVRFSDEAHARWMKAPAIHEKYIHFICRVPEANKTYELTLDLDDPESINSVVISTEKDEWFTLSGLRVSKPNVKGVYIHNGRKVLVR